MHPRIASFSTKLGRRMLLAFVFCALVPVCTLALLSYTQVTGQLHEQSRTRLWYASKSLGMTIYERLLFLEANLEAIQRDLSAERSGGGPGRGIPLRSTRPETLPARIISTRRRTERSEGVTSNSTLLAG